MAKFKKVPQVFLFRKLIEYWRNTVRNFDDECWDTGFFNVVQNCFDHDKAVELIELAYTPDELEEMRNVKTRRWRLNLGDFLGEVFFVLWNFARLRRKCRIVLDSICDYMLKENKERGKDFLEKRIEELSKALKLSALEREILTLAYIRSETCFVWPQRVDTRDKPLYYAMALDCSHSEVLAAMSPKGTLRKFHLLDCDFEFSSRTIGGFREGAMFFFMEHPAQAKRHSPVRWRRNLRVQLMKSLRVMRMARI